MNETSGTAPAGAAPQASDSAQPGGPDAAEASTGAPGFWARGRVRRRVRFLRKARELAYRDLGGLVFNLHRFGQRNDALVLNKLTTLEHIDAELRTLDTALGERDAVTVLREAGITACPRCAAIHGSDDRYCPNCGLSMGRHVDLPIAGPPAATVGSPVPGTSPTAGATAAPAAQAPPPPGQATASWPAPSTSGPAAAAHGEAVDAAAAPPVSGPAPTPAAKPTQAGGSAPAGAPEEEQTEILHPLEPDR